MKKFFRIFLIGFAALVIVLSAAAIALFQPSVQTWLARKAVANQPGMQVTIGRVHAGLSKIELTAVRVEQPGSVFDLPSATIEMPLVSAIRGKINAKKITAHGWTLDLSPSPPDGIARPKENAGAPVPAPAARASSAPGLGGFFDKLELPVDLSIEEADVGGTLILPPGEPDGKPVRAAIELGGGKLGQGLDGKFELLARAEMSDDAALVSKIEIQGTLAVRMATPRTFQSLALDAAATATGSRLRQGGRLRAHIAGARNASGEDYAISLKSGDSADAAPDKTLFNIRASNPAGPGGFNAMWLVDFSDADLEPFMLGMKLPAITASGQGTLTADDSLRQVQAGGKLSAQLDNFGGIVPELAALGPLHLDTVFGVVREGDLLRVSVFSADIATPTSPVATVRTLQLVELNLSTAALKVPDLDADLLRIDIHSVPLAWAGLFLRGTGLSVSGQPLRGTLAGRARDGGFVLRSVTPVTLGGLAVARQAAPLVQNADLSVSFSANIGNDGWSADVSEFSIQSHGAVLLSASCKAARPAAAAAAAAGKPGPSVSAAGAFRANLPALLAQPAAAAFRVLSEGGADGTFTVRLGGDVRQAAARITIDGLVSNDRKHMPKITTDARADLHADGGIDLHAPLVFEMDARKSDIDLAASIKPGAAARIIDASLASGALHADDLALFGALASQSSATEPGAQSAAALAPSASAEPAAPVWEGIEGQVKFLVRKLVSSPGIEAEDVSGVLKLTSSHAVLQDVRGALSGGAGGATKAEFKGGGALRFDRENAGGPYKADFTFALTNFDPAPILVAANPGKKPTVEGRFDISGTLSGAASSPEKIAGACEAEMSLTSRGGKFNGFAASAQGVDIAKIQKAAVSSSMMAAIGDTLLSLVGKNENAVILEKIRAGANALGRFVEINFDQLSIDAAYHPGKDMVIKNFTLLSPDMRFTGAGSLGGKPALALVKQALTMSLQLSVRGDQAKDLQTIGLLKKEPDALGYIPLVSDFVVEGSLSSLTGDALVKQITARLGPSK